jgi:hypothetical protein
MADVAVIRVLNQHRRWIVQVDGREDVRFNARGRGRAVEAALDLAETVSPALVVVHTADGRVRRTITVGPVSTDGTTQEPTRVAQ